MVFPIVITKRLLLQQLTQPSDYSYEFQKVMRKVLQFASLQRTEVWPLLKDSNELLQWGTVLELLKKIQKNYAKLF